MNKIILIGRLTDDPELKYTSSNIAVGNFSIAVDRRVRDNEGNNTTDFFKCVVWRKNAENMKQYTNKGSLVAVEGELHNRSYDDKDGIKRYTTEVQAERVIFLGSKKDKKESNIEESNEVANDYDPYANFGSNIEIDDDDLPFDN